MSVTLRNLWVRPDVHIVADEAVDQEDHRRARLKIDGLLCGLWVLNVRRALAGHPGIREVTMKGAGDLVEVTYATSDLAVADLRRLVMDTVLLPSLRNFLGRPSSSPT